jgi:hypothetical protein
VFRSPDRIGPTYSVVSFLPITHRKKLRTPIQSSSIGPSLSVTARVSAVTDRGENEHTDRLYSQRSVRGLTHR